VVSEISSVTTGCRNKTRKGIRNIVMLINIRSFKVWYVGPGSRNKNIEEEFRRSGPNVETVPCGENESWSSFFISTACARCTMRTEESDMLGIPLLVESCRLHCSGTKGTFFSRRLVLSREFRQYTNPNPHNSLFFFRFRPLILVVSFRLLTKLRPD